MASIDQRIVELKFDGKNFLSGIQAAISALDNLKKNLNMDKAVDEFGKVEKASKNVSFNELASSVDTISKRFSTLGIIGMSALNQLTTSAIQAGKNVLNALLDPLIEGGKRRALNIEQAKFQIEGLGYTWEQVESSINYGVKDTAYGLDAAAKACSMLLASQVGLGQEMDTSLRAISGVAAMTGSEYENIANIFTTVAGNGRLMGDQLLQLATRGLNAAATLGEYLGKTETEIRDMVSKGQIDFKTFAAAMDWAFGEHAKEANKTFTGALSNMKAALARIGAEFATPAYESLRQVFVSLIPVINGINLALTPLVDTAKAGMKYLTEFATKTLSSFGDKEGVAAKLGPTMAKINTIVQNFGTLLLGIAKTIGGIVIPIFSAFGEVLGGSLLDAIAGAIKILSDFMNSIAFTERMSENLKKTFTGIFIVVDFLFQILTSVISLVAGALFTTFSAVFGFVADVILAVTGHIGEFIVLIRNLITALLNLKTVKDLIGAITKAFATLKDGVTKVYTAFRQLVGVIIDRTFESALWIFDTLSTVILLVAKYIDLAVTKLRDFINWVKSLPAVQKFFETVRDTFSNLRENIGGVASELGSKFIAAFNNAKQIVGEFVERLKELINQYIELPSLQDVITTVVEFMTNVFEGAVTLFKNAKELLGNIFDRIAELNRVSLQGIISNLGKLRDKIIEVVDISGRLTFLSNLFTSIRDGAAKAAQGTFGILGSIKDNLIQFVEWVKGKFSQLTLGDAMAASMGGTFIVFLIQLTKFIKTAEKLTASFDKVVNFFNKITKSITKTIESFGELNKAKADQMRIEAISSLIKSVVLLAGAVALLASMDPQRVLISAGAILVLAGGLIGLSAAMNLISSKVDPKTITATAVQMGTAVGSILALVISLKILSTINVGELIAGLIAITVLMGEVLAFIFFMNKMEKAAPKIVTSAAAMLLVSTSILLLAKAVTMLGQVNPGDLMAAMVVVSVLMIAMGLMTRVAGQAGMAKSAAVGILASVASIYLVIAAIKMLANMDYNTLTNGLGRLVELFAALSILFIGLRVAGKHAASAGAAILLISVAMNIMVLAIKQMASIDDAMLNQATKSINEMLKIFALITLMSVFTGKHAWQAGAAIGMMSAAILVLSGAMVVLSRLDESDLKRATKVVTQILAMFALITAASGLVKQCEKTILQITICLGLLVGAVAVLALIEPANLISASLAISMLMATLALVLAASDVAKKSMTGVWQLVGVVGVLSILLIALSEIETDNALVAATALSELLVVIGGLILVMNKTGGMAPTAIESAAILAMAIDAFILIVGALVVVAGAISEAWPDLSDLLDKGIPILQKIGQALGEFIGGIVGGIAAGASYGLVTVAENLNKFIETLKPFMDEVSNIDDSVVDGAFKLTEMVLIFAAADFINSISAFKGSAIESLSENLPLLGQAIADFSSNLTGVSLDNLAVGAQAAKQLAEVGFLMAEGGLKSLIFGFPSEGMSAFSENLPLLGQAITDYGNSVENIKADAIQGSIGPLKALVEINNMIETEGFSVKNFLFGSHTDAMGWFSENLAGLGTALTNYGDNVENLKASAIESSIGPLKALVEINNLIEGEGFSVKNFLFGSHTDAIKWLSENLAGLGIALTNYGDNVENLKASAVENSIGPLRALVEINNMIESEGISVKCFLFGSNSEAIKNLSTNLPGLGTALKDYSKNIRGLNAEAVAASVEPLRNLVEISNMIDKEGGALGWLFADSSTAVENLATNLPVLGQALRDYGVYVRNVNAEAINNSVNCLNSIINVLNGAKEGISAIFGGGTSGGITVLNDNLPKLGEALLSYSNYVADISVEKIDASIDAITRITEAVGNGAGYSESMRTFGFDLKTFGEAYAAFLGELNGLPYEAIDAAIDSLNKLRETINAWDSHFPDISPSLTKFVNGLKTASKSGVDAFINTFRNATAEAGNTARALVDYALTQMVNRLNRANSDFLSRGRVLMTNLANGMKAAIPTVTATLDSLLSQLSTRLRRAENDFTNHGRMLSTNLANGIKAASSLVSTALDSTLNSLESKVRGQYNAMYNAGYYLMSGLSAGISGNSSGPVNAAYNVGVAVVNALKQATDQASPSKEAIKVGRFVDLGLMVGLTRYASKAIGAATEVGEEIIDEFDAVSSELAFLDDLEPVITPTLDTSDIDKGIAHMNSQFSSAGSIPISMQGAYASTAFHNMAVKRIQDEEIQNGIQQQVINNYDLTQNNYSPKALSRIDIYRDTRNQFSRLKEVVNA